MICFGPLVILFCTAQHPAPVSSDFCKLMRPEVQKIMHLSNEEIAALQRPRKEALVSIKLKYQELCK